jgi:hypothetical protein
MSGQYLSVYSESFQHLLVVFTDCLIKFPGKWMATFQGRVLGPTDDRKSLQALLDREGLDRKQCAITVLDQRTMLL